MIIHTLYGLFLKLIIFQPIAGEYSSAIFKLYIETNFLRHNKHYEMWPKGLQSLIGTFCAPTMTFLNISGMFVTEELRITVSWRAPDKEAVGQAPITIVPNS